MLILWAISTIDCNNNGVFKHERIGKEEKKISIYKFRTMIGNYTSSVTSSQMKITPWGKFLRKYKLDELPQIINILQNKMSFVGPRPDTQEMIDILTSDEKQFLKIKPGITGPAQIKYKNEEQLLFNHPNPEEYYKNIIWKDKVNINNDYYYNRTFKKDIFYLIETLL